MDGVNSTSMRKKGVSYKTNFGVPIMTLRKMALNYAPDKILAENLWKENTRELKILATMIQPASDFLGTLKWVEEIDNLELAEQASMNLFSKTQDAPENASRLISSKALYEQICGYLIYSRLFMSGYTLNETNRHNYFQYAFEALNNESILLKSTALNSLKKLGLQSKTLGNEIIEMFNNEFSEKNEQKQAIYEDLMFDFNYYS